MKFRAGVTPLVIAVLLLRRNSNTRSLTTIWTRRCAQRAIRGLRHERAGVDVTNATGV